MFILKHCMVCKLVSSFWLDEFAKKNCQTILKKHNSISLYLCYPIFRIRYQSSTSEGEHFLVLDKKNLQFNMTNV